MFALEGQGATRVQCLMKVARLDAEGEGLRGLFSSGYQGREGLGFLRFCMVLAGFAPLFVLMAIRGIEIVPDIWLWTACASLLAVPTLLLLLRLLVVWRYEPPRHIVVGQVEESRSHILIYLFATYLPFYRQDLGNMRDLIAIVVAILFVIFLFWHLNLHYVNILLAVFGYRVYTIRPKDNEENPFTSRIALVVITRQRSLVPGRNIKGYRLSDSLYWGCEP